MQLSLLNALTLVFVVLKLTDVIDWSWWLVFAPTIASFVIGLITMAIMLLLMSVGRLADW